jgi:hypothetical protein
MIPCHRIIGSDGVWLVMVWFWKNPILSTDAKNC